MTNKIAIWLGLLISFCILLDFVLTGGNSLLFISKKFYELLDWVAFWR